ncbi:MAG TPA: alanyl-tRNA editing protein, partial [Mizugakiibacter sp.]|nr:alanyl-tRNA editing protein [Mizugakiibacter sp.]
MNTRTLERFYDDVNLRECAATVLQHDERGLMTDVTVFYPNGGGQPGDVGQVRLE